MFLIHTSSEIHPETCSVYSCLLLLLLSDFCRHLLQLLNLVLRIRLHCCLPITYLHFLNLLLLCLPLCLPLSPCHSLLLSHLSLLSLPLLEIILTLSTLFTPLLLLSLPSHFLGSPAYIQLPVFLFLLLIDLPLLFFCISLSLIITSINSIFPLQDPLKTYLSLLKFTQ